MKKFTNLLLLSVGLAGCATLSPRRATELVWPAPPLTPRIQFVGVVRTQDDLIPSADGKPFSLMDTLLGPKAVPSALRQPMGVAASPDGSRLYIADYAKPGLFVADFAAKQLRPFGPETGAFERPFGIAVDAQGAVYVVDSSTKQITVLAADGTVQRTIAHESLERPTGIAVDTARQRVYVADSASSNSEHHVIQVFDLAGQYVTTFGARGNAEGQFAFPTYLALDAAGNLYVADTFNARIQVLDQDGRHLKTIGEHGDAIGMFDKPKGVALDGFGNVYVADSSWSNVQIFNERGQALLFFGGRGHIGGLLFNPTGVAIDRNNRIYVADAFNERISIYQLVNTTPKDSFIEVSTVKEGR